MDRNWRTSLKPTFFETVLYAFWAASADSPMGPGGYLMHIPFVAIGAYILHSLLRWMIRKPPRY